MAKIRSAVILILFMGFNIMIATPVLAQTPTPDNTQGPGGLICPADGLVPAGAAIDPDYFLRCGACFRATPEPIELTATAIAQQENQMFMTATAVSYCISQASTQSVMDRTATPEGTRAACQAPTIQAVTPTPAVTSTQAVTPTPQPFQAFMADIGVQTCPGGWGLCGGWHNPQDYCGEGGFLIGVRADHVSSGSGDNNIGLWVKSGAAGSDSKYGEPSGSVLSWGVNSWGQDVSAALTSYYNANRGTGWENRVGGYEDWLTSDPYDGFGVSSGAAGSKHLYAFCYGVDPSVVPTPTPTATPNAGLDCTDPVYNTEPAMIFEGFVAEAADCKTLLPALSLDIPLVDVDLNIEGVTICYTLYSFPNLKILDYTLPLSIFSLVPGVFLVRRLFNL